MRHGRLLTWLVVPAAAMPAGCSRHVTCLEAEGTVLSLDLPTTADARTLLDVPTPFDTRFCQDGLRGTLVEIDDVWIHIGLAGDAAACAGWGALQWRDDRILAWDQPNAMCTLEREACTVTSDGGATLLSYASRPDTGDAEGWCTDMAFEIEFAEIR